MTLNPLMSYDFNGAGVRMIERDGEPWWIAADVAEILGYRNAPNMTRMLDDDEKGTHNMSTLGTGSTHNVRRTCGADDENTTHIASSISAGNPNVTIINESGLYNAILRSRRPEAKAFRKWVTAELLPSLRKHGFYGAPPEIAATGRPNGFIEARTMVVRHRERERLIERLSHERNRAVRAALTEHLARISALLDLPAPLSLMPGADLDAAALQARFFAGLTALSQAGVPWNLHKSPNTLIAVNPAVIEAQFRTLGHDIRMTPAMLSALKLHLDFIAYKPILTAENRSRRCLILQKQNPGA